MHRFWNSIIEPIFSILKPRIVVEIGSDQGDNTRKLLQYCQKHNGTLHSIDPLPRFDVTKWKEEYGDTVVFHVALSLNALSQINHMDAVLIDGDHNWYTVFNELKLIEKGARKSKRGFPLVLLHDIGWPYGRRDLYYDPDTIPEAYRKPYTKQGIKPGKGEPVEQGGVNSHLFNAIYENDLQNGVLTAVEDFIEEAEIELELIKVPIVSGLGILFPQELKMTNPDFGTFVETLSVPSLVSAIIEQAENARIDSEVGRHEAKALRDKDLAKLKEHMAATEHEQKVARQEIEQFQSTVASRDDELREKGTKVAELTELLAAKGRDEDAAREEIEQLKSGFNRLERALSEKEEHLVRLDVELNKRSRLAQQLREMVELFQQKNPELNQHWEETNRQLFRLRSDLEALLSSRRWQLGDGVIRAIEKCLMRPKVPMAVDHMWQVLDSMTKSHHDLRQILSEISRKIVTTENSCMDQDVLISELNTNIQNNNLLPRVSVISAIFNKAESLPDFIKAMAEQSYEGTIEMVFVDDVSTDESREIVQCLKSVNSIPGKLMMHLLKNPLNVGNCGSRNRGLIESTGDILVVVDADCIVNSKFIEERVAAHNQGYDVCIGPMGIESHGRNIERLHELLQKDESALKREMRLQYPSVETAFVNCVTRNFSITRYFLNSVGRYLFDESFAYKKGFDSGFGWEDVEMAYRLFINRARIWFVKTAISIHKSHKPEFSDSEKSLMSVKNFRKLFDKYPEIIQVAPDWAKNTFAKIENWLNKYNYTENEDASHIAEHLNKITAGIPVRSKSKGRLKIATYRWHVGHQYDLWKLPHDFTLFYGLSGITTSWDYNSRPLPENAKFERIGLEGRKPDFDKYDLAILHFDEFSLHPELSLGRLSECWGEQFKYMMENFPGPKVAICHGVPVFKGACNPHYDKPDLGEMMENYRKELVEYIGDTPVICNSYQAQKEWAFRNSRVVWHGFDPLMYPPSSHSDKIVTIVGDITSRPYYRGLEFYKKVMEKIDWDADILADGMPNSIERPILDEKFYKTENELGMASFLNYTHFLSSYGIFFNPTLTSPMPRTRGEALISGLALISTSAHDADLFIEHGYNGFLSDDADECSLILAELKQNEDLRRKIGKRGRELALDVFHVNRFIKDWAIIIEKILSTNKRGFNAVIAGTDSLSVRPKVRCANPKRIAFVCGASEDASTTRYRVDAAIEALEHQGVMTDRIFSDQLKNMTDSFYVGKYSLIVCHRVVMSDSYAKLVAQAKKYGILLVADIDDLLFDNDYASLFDEIKRRPYKAVAADVERFRKALSMIQYATVTTPTLCKELHQLGLANIEIVPNTVMDEILFMSNAAYKERLTRSPREEILIGYPSGSKTHAMDFQIALPALVKLLDKYPKVKLVLMGEIEIPKELVPFGNRVEMAKFVKPVYLPKNLASIDINITPLQHRLFCECKSNLKYIEAGLVGIPTVASPTEPLLQTIEHGRNGFIAKSEKEWFDCLCQLVDDKILRKNLGEVAREDCLANYTSRNRRERLLKVYTSWLEGR